MQNVKNAKKRFWALTRKNPEPRFWGIFWSLWEHFGSLRLTFGGSFGRRGAPMAPGTDRPGGNLDRNCGPNLWTEIADRHFVEPKSRPKSGPKLYPEHFRGNKPLNEPSAKPCHQIYQFAKIWIYMCPQIEILPYFAMFLTRQFRGKFSRQFSRQISRQLSRHISKFSR